jgi:AcrR family transcriptional regulator
MRLAGRHRRRGSRRSAARHETLDRRRLLKAALALIDRDGPQRFSIRRLANELGVTPMAVYNHVSSKADLLEGIANAAIEGATYPSPHGDWRRVLRGWFQALRRACLDHPGAIPLIESAERLPAAVFRPMETTLSALQQVGFGVEDALRAYFLLVTFTLGQASYQIKEWGRGIDAGSAVKENRISGTTFPAVTQAAMFHDWDFDMSFEFGLSIILTGLEARIPSRSRSDGRERSRR